MADIDLMPARGVPFRARVTEDGIAFGGTLTSEQLAQRGMHPVCTVSASGLSGAIAVPLLAARGIRAVCLVDENGLAGDSTPADELRRRGIRPMVALTALGLSGATTMQQLAQRGLDYACLVNESGTAI